MLKIPAKSKYKDLSSDTKIYYALAIGIFITILSYILYRGFLVTLTMIASTIVVYILLSRKPRKTIVTVSEEGIMFDEDLITWNNVIGWASVELEDDMIEFVVETTTVRKKFYYFYMPGSQKGLKEFVLEIGKHIPYMEDIPAKNVVHNFLRRFELM